MTIIILKGSGSLKICQKDIKFTIFKIRICGYFAFWTFFFVSVSNPFNSSTTLIFQPEGICKIFRQRGASKQLPHSHLVRGNKLYFELMVELSIKDKLMHYYIECYRNIVSFIFKFLRNIVVVPGLTMKINFYLKLEAPFTILAFQSCDCSYL